MTSNEITPSYSKALELHNKILVSAQLAQQNLWEMCSGLKEMRDGKLYKELGYQNFEEYCGTEFNMTARNARNYISIIENISAENRKTFSAFSTSKLYLLSTLSESEQEKITAENNVESLTVKQLEAEIKNLRRANDEKKSLLQSLNDRLSDANDSLANYRCTISRLNTQNDKLQEQIKDLEFRPVEVAVTEPSEDVRQLKLTIKNLERVSADQIDRLQEDHLAAERQIHQKYRQGIERQRNEFEERIAELEVELEDAENGGTTHDGELGMLDIYIKTAHDALFSLIGFASKCSDKSACFSAVKTLLAEFQEANDELIYGRR